MYNNNSFWFETNKVDKENFRSFYFNNPVKIIKMDHPEEMNDFFLELDDLINQFYVAGFFSYELGYLLEEAFEYKTGASFPYAYFCAYDEPAIYDHRLNKFINGYFDFPKDNLEYEINNLSLSISENDYIENIKKVRDYIRKGDIYQANFTIKHHFDFAGSPLGLYLDLKSKQNVAYNVFGKFNDYYIISLTPELFFHKNNNKIIVKPMKGTHKRGRNILEDKAHSLWLQNDQKNQSENIMIVDLLRNDIGKISEGGSVIVKKLYEIEKYNTLFQMTSTIESVLEKNISTYDLIKSIFPSGSVTGAPKIRSMEIIKQLEKEDRKIYTGSIGFFEPSGNATFNVAIRTILLKGCKGEMGIGGGIVYDSTPEGEFSECKLKANFLVQKSCPEFSLIETMLFDKKLENLELHIKRMLESAEYFDYRFDKGKLLCQLNRISESLDDGRYKVRILLDRSGEIQITRTKLEDVKRDFKIIISKLKTDSNDIFLYHKTTNRELYEKELKTAREMGFFDVIFLNEKDEITEGSITNVYIKKNGNLYTPPLECGLLNGTVREYMINNHNIQEDTISLNNLKNAEAIYISNSIIGLRETVLYEG